MLADFHQKHRNAYRRLALHSLACLLASDHILSKPPLHLRFTMDKDSAQLWIDDITVMAEDHPALQEVSLMVESSRDGFTTGSMAKMPNEWVWKSVVPIVFELKTSGIMLRVMSSNTTMDLKPWGSIDLDSTVIFQTLEQLSQTSGMSHSIQLSYSDLGSAHVNLDLPKFTLAIKCSLIPDDGTFPLVNSQLELLDSFSQNPLLLSNAIQTFQDGIGLQKILPDTLACAQAVSKQQFGIALLPSGHRLKSLCLAKLGMYALDVSKQLDDIHYCNDVITYQKILLKLCPSEAAVPAWLNHLGQCLKHKFLKLNNLDDLNEAIMHLQMAVSLTPDGHYAMPGRLNNLGNCLECRYLRLDDLSALNEAITKKKQAVTLTPDAHSSMPGRLSNLGNSLESRFYRMGDLDDLNEAITRLQLAVTLTPDGDPSLPGRRTNLGNSLEARFLRLGNLIDVNEAIKSHQLAVGLTPQGDPDMPKFLHNLGNALESRFSHLHTLDDIHGAIKNHQTAVELTPEKHMDMPGRLNSLGNCLKSRFVALKALQDLNEAIDNYRLAVRLTPDGHPTMPAQLNNLSNSLQLRSSSNDLDDLNEAISNWQLAIEQTPKKHPNRLNYLVNLAISLERRSKERGINDDLNSAISLYQEASFEAVGNPYQKIWATKSYASLLANRDPERALEAWQCAINLLPQLAWIGLPFSMRHERLVDYASISQEAACFAFDEHNSNLALQWLEQGRGVVWTTILHLQKPLDSLMAVNPALADSLQKISQKLQWIDMDLHTRINEPSVQQGFFHSQVSWARQWEDLVSKVRQIPDFEDFLQIKDIQHLLPLGSLGHIVVLHATQTGTHALTLGQRGIKHFELTGCSKKDIIELTAALADILKQKNLGRLERGIQRETTSRNGYTFKQVLQYLWINLAKPLFDHLGLKLEANTVQLPRIWWCPIGPLAFLPLHTAGIYNSGLPLAGARVSDYVISSYTPSVTALQNAYESSQSKKPFKLLAVAQPDPVQPDPKKPRLNGLPGTMEEFKSISVQFSSLNCSMLQKEQATVPKVLKELETASWVHFACHGIQDIINPTQSALALPDGYLRLSNIVANKHQNAEFAFLSACQTSMGDAELPDEAIHLAAGMLMTGYSGVIGTMWSISDTAGPFVTKEVYKEMWTDGKPDHTKAAAALQNATTKLCETGADFTKWVPFVHIGY